MELLPREVETGNLRTWKQRQIVTRGMLADRFSIGEPRIQEFPLRWPSTSPAPPSATRAQAHEPEQSRVRWSTEA